MIVIGNTDKKYIVVLRNRLEGIRVMLENGQFVKALNKVEEILDGPEETGENTNES